MRPRRGPAPSVFTGRDLHKDALQQAFEQSPGLVQGSYSTAPDRLVLENASVLAIESSATCAFVDRCFELSPGLCR